MAKQVKTNVAVEEYEFLDANDNVMFKIALNPGDVGIASRYEEVVDYLNLLNIPADEGVDIGVELDKIKTELGAKLDNVFNMPISSQIFSVMHPFAVLADGRLYIEEIVDKICGVIEAELNVRTKKVQSRLAKYAAKYHK